MSNEAGPTLLLILVLLELSHFPGDDEDWCSGFEARSRLVFGPLEKEFPTSPASLRYTPGCELGYLTGRGRGDRHLLMGILSISSEGAKLSYYEGSSNTEEQQGAQRTAAEPENVMRLQERSVGVVRLDPRPVRLEPFSHQVAGQSSLLMLDPGTVCKPMIPREHKLYRSLPDPLRPFIPCFHGLLYVRLEEGDDGSHHLWGYYPDTGHDGQCAGVDNSEALRAPVHPDDIRDQDRRMEHVKRPRAPPLPLLKGDAAGSSSSKNQQDFTASAKSVKQRHFVDSGSLTGQASEPGLSSPDNRRTGVNDSSNAEENGVVSTEDLLPLLPGRAAWQDRGQGQNGDQGGQGRKQGVRVEEGPKREGEGREEVEGGRREEHHTTGTSMPMSSGHMSSAVDGPSSHPSSGMNTIIVDEDDTVDADKDDNVDEDDTVDADKDDNVDEDEDDVVDEDKDEDYVADMMV
ncbi:uncharacterized protein LOC143280304 [Babylonia areolata]|uniref:uncharacterized protein LOC143280304 n=1 Tax=Babylonia areolata TaxID=304850 RepID=UPI003FD45FBD